MSSFFNIYFYLNFYLTQALDDSPAMNVPGVGNFENTGKSGRGDLIFFKKLDHD